MFFGLINFNSYIFFLKFSLYNYCYIFLKLNFFNNYIKLGDSFSLQGFCLTLLNRNLFFFEFDLNEETLYNLKNLYYYKFLNSDLSFNIYNNNDGNFILGHINNNIFLFKKYIYFNNFYKFYFIYNYLYKNYFFYKISICLNGISLTINSFYNFNFEKIFCLNIIKYTYFVTNLKILKIFSNLNLEYDLILYYLINYFYV